MGASLFVEPTGAREGEQGPGDECGPAAGHSPAPSGNEAKVHGPRASLQEEGVGSCLH